MSALKNKSISLDIIKNTIKVKNFQNSDKEQFIEALAASVDHGLSEKLDWRTFTVASGTDQSVLTGGAIPTEMLVDSTAIASGLFKTDVKEALREVESTIKKYVQESEQDEVIEVERFGTFSKKGETINFEPLIGKIFGKK